MMKIIFKKKVWIVFLLVLCVSHYAVAQVVDTSQITWDETDPLRLDTCQSTWTRYSPINESSSLVRGSGYYRVVLIQNTVDRSHTFVVTKYSDGTERAVKTYFNCNGCEVDITDMRLFQGNCYFCGTIRYHADFRTGDSYTKGIVGHFSVSLLCSGIDGIYIYVVQETSQLKRLAISRTNISNKKTTLVSIIGKQDPGGNDCMVELAYDETASTWKKRIGRVVQPSEGIVFTDLLNTGDSITLLSQYKCANQEFPNGSNYDYRHQIFLLDRFGLEGCSISCNPSYLHYMMHYVMDLNDNCSYHYDEAPMRLFHLDDLNMKFGVAFGVRKTNANLGGIRLFTFHNARQYDSSRISGICMKGTICSLSRLTTATQTECCPHRCLAARRTMSRC